MAGIGYFVFEDLNVMAIAQRIKSNAQITG
jgi:hypothetical protein